MSSRLCGVFSALMILVFTGCSTDPEIDWDRMEEYNLVTGSLTPYPVSIDTSSIVDSVLYLYRQRIRVERLKSLIGFAFDPERDYRTGLSGAIVTVSGSDSTYLFTESSDGYYIWERYANFFRYGRWYRLDVILPDGNLATSEIYTPKIYLEEGADTIWIQPDSIAVWSSDPWSPMPIATEGPHYKHEIKYRCTPETHLEHHRSRWYEWWVNGFPFISEYLFHRLELTDSTIVVYTAVESPTWFRRNFENVTISDNLVIARHNRDQDLDNLHWDDIYPIDNIEEISNIDGAYGIFTATRYSPEHTFVLALKPDGG